MIKLLVTGAFDYSQEELHKLEKLGYEIIFIQDERIPLEIDVSDIYGVICNSLFLHNDIRKFKKLKIIQLTSAGLDRVPLDYINENKIKVYKANDIYSIPMAEWAVLKILEIYKRSKEFYYNQEKHQWKKQRDLLELSNKTASIIGFGSIGSEIAKRLKAFGVNIIGVDIHKITSKFIDYSFSMDNLENALNNSDIVILTLPLTEETKYFINKDTIGQMKDKSVLINISRGKLIDENQLIVALNKGKFLGVALDVFEEEPLGASDLWDLENVIITPHNSFVSDQIRERLFNLIIENLKTIKIQKDVRNK